MHRFAAGIALLASALTVVGCDGVSPSADGGSDAPPCTADLDCDDGVFCNGEEVCSADGCVAGEAPCPAGCDESREACVECDVDGDGSVAIACGEDDCDDNDPDRHPGATEVCDAAGVDEDCDDTTFGARDADTDGYVSAACCNDAHCGDDCDDGRPSTYPGASETCDGIDNDCDGAVDESTFAWYPDCDADGFGDAAALATPTCIEPALPPSSCPSGGWRRNANDCDDAEGAVYPGAPQICDRLQNDCDDAEDVGPSEDLDGDGHAPVDAACASGPLPKDDCDDDEATVHPGGDEVCDGLDNDCDGFTTDGACGGATPVCDLLTNRCVGCVVRADCASLDAPECGLEQECVGCEGNEACAGRAGTLACDEVSGSCVECTATNTSACGGRPCRPDGTCSAYASGRVACEACDTDRNCAAGHLCVEMSYALPSPGVIGTFCLWTRDAALPGPNGSCYWTLQSRPFATEAFALSVDGQAGPVCTLRTTTCPALSQHTMPDADCVVPVTDDDACGVEGFTDGRCRLNSATQPRCTYPCVGNEDCPSGSTCPAAGDRYCSI